MTNPQFKLQQKRQISTNASVGAYVGVSGVYFGSEQLKMKDLVLLFFYGNRRRREINEIVVLLVLMFVFLEF